ncbi:hypothetical protein PSTG_06945 [Puccinia striiformis f. sp. tritici PST-78]|uniref:HTH CENPB-type domain-containing protein n=1 Tax=Puccinia striiformis f. sp. tritici PST-78 TaxID=1165861 RepID=A0A0L0VKQ1_9BASI|nr:hypothetical protein PSTG_06945 [Puccinia striiformis f. sp. tritici PST-78]
MNEGESLTAYEEEWLDVEGNLVSGELLISHLSTISSASSNQSICLSSDDVKTVLEINNFRPKDSTKVTLQKKAVTKKNQLKQIPTSRKQSQPTKVLANSQISNASYAEKVQVLDWHHKNGTDQTKTCEHFKNIFHQLRIKKPLLSKWLKAKDSICEKHQQSSHNATKQIQTVSYPKVEAALSEWMTQAIHYGLPVSGEILKEKWQDFARLGRIPSEEWLKLSSGWLESFKNQHQICVFRKHSKAASVDITVVESEIVRMQEITKDYELKDIFNMDKTGLFYSMPPDVGLAFKATHGVKSDKTWMTIALTCNPDGSKKKPPLFIGKSKKPQCFKGHTANYYNYQHYKH